MQWAFGERDRAHVTFISLRRYGHSILLSVIVVHLIPRLVDKLGSITGVYVQGKTQYIQGSALSAISGIRWGPRNIPQVGKGGMLLLA